MICKIRVDFILIVCDKVDSFKLYCFCYNFKLDIFVTLYSLLMSNNNKDNRGNGVEKIFL